VKSAPGKERTGASHRRTIANIDRPANGFPSSAKGHTKHCSFAQRERQPANWRMSRCSDYSSTQRTDVLAIDERIKGFDFEHPGF
jgi:hypothetical protein